MSKRFLEGKAECPQPIELVPDSTQAPENAGEVPVEIAAICQETGLGIDEKGWCSVDQDGDIVHHVGHG